MGPGIDGRRAAGGAVSEARQFEGRQQLGGAKSQACDERHTEMGEGAQGSRQRERAQQQREDDVEEDLGVSGEERASEGDGQKENPACPL